MQTIKLFISLLCVTVLNNITSAQTDCNNSLYQANKLYEDGKISDAITKLEPCISSEMSSDELLESYKLLASAYSDLKNEESRDKYLLLLLKLEPNYNKKPHNDSKEMTTALKKFNVSPKMHLGLAFGANNNSPNLQQSYSALSVDQRYIATIGYQVGLVAEYHVLKNTSATVGASYRGLGIQHEMVEADVWKKDYTEIISTTQINLGGLQYWKLSENLKGFAGLDFGIGLLNNAQVNVKTENFVLGTIQQQTKDVTTERISSITNAGIKLGIAYELEDLKVTFDIGYCNYFNTTVDQSLRLSDQDFIFNTQYINDDINPRLMMFNLGISFPMFYKISK